MGASFFKTAAAFAGIIGISLSVQLPSHSRSLSGRDTSDCAPYKTWEPKTYPAMAAIPTEAGRQIGQFYQTFSSGLNVVRKNFGGVRYVGADPGIIPLSYIVQPQGGGSLYPFHQVTLEFLPISAEPISFLILNQIGQQIGGPVQIPIKQPGKKQTNVVPTEGGYQVTELRLNNGLLGGICFQVDRRAVK
jgi:hypothetical protein